MQRPKKEHLKETSVVVSAFVGRTRTNESVKAIILRVSDSSFRSPDTPFPLAAPNVFRVLNVVIVIYFRHYFPLMSHK